MLEKFLELVKNQHGHGSFVVAFKAAGADVFPQRRIAYAWTDTKTVDAIVLEALYSTIDVAWDRRVEMRIPRVLAPLAVGGHVDARSDLFCLGIVLYEMLVGERCFAGASDFSTLNLMREAVVTAPTKINKTVPPGLEAIVLKSLSREPKARYQDGLEFEAALAGMMQ